MGSKKELKKIIERLLNAQMQNQPLALSVPELRYIRGRVSIALFFVLFPKVPIIGYCQRKEPGFL